jgi:hypothetical protein
MSFLLFCASLRFCPLARDLLRLSLLCRCFHRLAGGFFFFFFFFSSFLPLFF